MAYLNIVQKLYTLVQSQIHQLLASRSRMKDVASRVLGVELVYCVKKIHILFITVCQI